MVARRPASPRPDGRRLQSYRPIGIFERTLGQAETGRVITGAATIMILVFLSFLFGQQLIIDQFGVGLAGAVIVDAFLIRTVLVPAAMHLSGNASWWLPRWLDRVLPQLSVDLPGPPPPAVPAGLTGPDAVPADTTAP